MMELQKDWQLLLVRLHVSFVSGARIRYAILDKYV
jgi:hypothetical protein